MCTYQNFELSVEGSAKGPTGWIRVDSATVYFDHPVHAFAEHTLNIDLSNSEGGPAARVAIELTAAAARALAETILAALDAVPPAMLETSTSSPGLATVGATAATEPGHR